MTPGSFERMGEPRTMVRSRLKTVFGCHQPNLYLGREARVYDSGVGTGGPLLHYRSRQAPTVAVVWGAKAKPPVSPYAPAALLLTLRVCHGHSK